MSGSFIAWLRTVRRDFAFAAALRTLLWEQVVALRASVVRSSSCGCAHDCGGAAAAVRARRAPPAAAEAAVLAMRRARRAPPAAAEAAVLAKAAELAILQQYETATSVVNSCDAS